MYCPTCGSEERHPAQFCRSCGTDVRAVRLTLEKPDEITASAASAREMIGRAIADKIRDTPPELLKKVAEEVLPEIEKFLESPDDRRLRRTRNGVVTSMIGAGVGISAWLLLLLVHNADIESMNMLVAGLGAGIIVFLIGIGIIINAFFFTLPTKQLPAPILDKVPDVLDTSGAEPLPLRSASTASPIPAVSVTEHTTQHLATKTK
jgi:hypothetical protein